MKIFDRPLDRVSVRSRVHVTEVVTVRYEPVRGDLNRDGILTPADAAIALQIAAGSGSASCDTATSTAADCQWRWQCNIPRRWILIMRLVLARVLVAAASATPVAITRHQDSEKNARQTWL